MAETVQAATPIIEQGHVKEWEPRRLRIRRS
jgi:hypothetical protein